MSNEITVFEKNFPMIAQRGIDESTWNAITQTIFPGCRQESALMAVDYCLSRELDIMMKPVHIVPMSVRNAQTGGNEWRDVVMPGIGLYRIQADRSGNYAGNDEPEFGPMVTTTLDNQSFTHPEYCKYTVYKMIGGNRVPFTAKEYWLENYAAKSRKESFPNAMWQKRPMAQLAKCAEAQALRKAWPEIGSQPTFEEMEGKEIDITPQPEAKKEKESTKAISNSLRSKRASTTEKKADPKPEKNPEPQKDVTQEISKDKEFTTDDTGFEEFTPYDEVSGLINSISDAQSAKEAGQAYKKHKDNFTSEQRKAIFPKLQASLKQYGFIK